MLKGAEPILKPGSEGWDRTTDQLINSQLLLPLSYFGINIFMCHKCRELIEQLIKENQKEFATPKEKLAWQRGYLTGMLSSLLHHEPQIRSHLTKQLRRR